uniref:Uncharacterized protein n=1 Tax=Aureoumbra lagunensis TaxID=44058 RepID=A0A7S3JQ87_9STRA
MLAADKLMLEASIRQSAMSLKEKEFLLHHDNLNTVGTQAAVMAGFSVTALIEFGPLKDGNRILKFFYYNAVIIAMAANILCVVQTTCLSVKGTSLAMRGPYGSVAKAVDGMYAVRRRVFALFGLGMLALFFFTILGSWLILDFFSAMIATTVVLAAIYTTFDSYRLISYLFHFDEAEAVSFDDILTKFKDPPTISSSSRSSSLSRLDDIKIQADADIQAQEQCIYASSDLDLVNEEEQALLLHRQRPRFHSSNNDSFSSPSALLAQPKKKKTVSAPSSAYRQQTAGSMTKK